eukprot:TRINITY_DN2200_c0_g1_i1.p1 TRINITY_DN2200_c0_g1~~TRINITY_DN2200_c0_g1_i1.p1  ORF type:complete len:616 (+),score=125.36 TRINITY_DN2200_c0_g1_i1:40-1887(+)
MGCGASGEVSQQPEDEPKMSVREDSEDNYRPLTLQEKKQRRQRIENYRKNILESKMTDVSAEELLDDEVAECLVAMVEQMQQPAVFFMSDGMVLYINKKAMILLGHTHYTFKPGNSLDKILTFDAVTPPAAVPSQNGIVAQKGIDPFSRIITQQQQGHDVYVTLTTETGDVLRCTAHTMMVNFEPYTTYVTVINIEKSANQTPRPSPRPSFPPPVSPITNGIPRNSSGNSVGSDAKQTRKRDLGKVPGSPRTRAKPTKLSIHDDDSGESSDDMLSRASSTSSIQSILKKAEKKAWAHGDITFTVDNAGLILGASHGAQKLLAMPLSDLIGNDIDSYLSDDCERSLKGLILSGELHLCRINEEEKKIAFRLEEAPNEFEICSIVGITIVTTANNEVNYVARLVVYENANAKRKKLLFSFKGGISEEIAAVYEQSTSAIIVTNLGGECIYCNELCTSIIKYNPEEILGEDISLVVPYPYRTVHGDNIKHIYSKVSPRFFNTPRATVMVTKLGKIIPIKLEITELVTPQNKAMYVASFKALDSRNLADIHAMLPSLVARCESDDRNTADSIAAEQRNRQEVRKERKSKQSIASTGSFRRCPRSPRQHVQGIRKNLSNV